MSPGEAVVDPVAFAAAHNARLTEETERRLRLAQRDAWLGDISRRVAKVSILAAEARTGRMPSVTVQLQP